MAGFKTVASLQDPTFGVDLIRLKVASLTMFG